MTKSENQVLWQTRIDEQERSGQKQRAWCKDNNINYHNFQYWNKRLKQISETEFGDPVQFISLTPVKQQSLGNMSLTIGQVKLEWYEGIKPSELDQILQVISRYA